MNVLEIDNLSVRYDGHNAVDGINFSVKEGDLLGIVGPNGAGKTTLFRAILGLQNYTGDIKLFGYSGKHYYPLLPLIGYVSQKVNFEQNFPATVKEVVSMGIISEKKLHKGATLLQNCGCCWNRIYKKIEKSDERAIEALKTVGLESLSERRIGELSGGELQRVFIAKALVKDPVLLILDEPVTGVDVETQNKFYNILKKINTENKITIVWSSHDLEAISNLANRVACMNRKLFFHGEKEEFFSNKDLLKTYTESAMQMHMHHHD
ncbi:MAG: metal ABC transporter ATP-binding protein [Candidatus Nitrosotenuis sp.]|uniref:Zinc uptake system ATP-binding protein ZurA n=1 Tax=Candidatus Nitrosotenuis uzonensis TaxID=1407055 RepID=V6AR73_9ARCH|nr:metal ABC transporter ATP-binding protein [Candidatus Nitrosotenuis uzonensis]CAE6491947.1 Zinc uptake system ATP-binding protein ZurA [Candidatus Nitrosotenuis uzonensis]CDI04918.1 Zinc uptake system ATP-binding protein zurA [Candidatus Nitrosotenuis uzonensis]